MLREAVLVPGTTFKAMCNGLFVRRPAAVHQEIAAVSTFSVPQLNRSWTILGLGSLGVLAPARRSGGEPRLWAARNANTHID